MANFQENREQIRRIRLEYAGLSAQKYRLQQEVMLLDARLAASEAPVDSTALAGREAIEQDLSNIIEALGPVEKKLEAALANLYLDADGRQLVKEWDDHLPVLLLPVKVETRFITVKHTSRHIPPSTVFDVSNLQPDLRFLFEDLLAENQEGLRLPRLEELKFKGHSATASAIKKQIKRGILAPANGEWIQRVPDKKELWVRIFPDDIFLHAHEQALLEAEYLAGQTYWQRLWEAESLFQENTNDDREQVRLGQLGAAWEALQYAFDPPRAKWIIKATQPLNYQSGETDFSKAPDFPAIEQKSTAWTEASRTFVLPDQFVVRLYQGDSFREVQGTLIPDDLPLGLDPVADSFSEDESQLSLPEKLQWLTDFEAAETRGMAIRVPLSDTEFNTGFDRLVVLGIKLSSDESNSQELAETLFYNHQYKSGGLSFLPQGIPTNQPETTDVLQEQAEQEHAAHLQAFEASETRQERITDGQRLATALGLSGEVFKRVPGQNEMEVEEAAAMNHLLWPASLGYFLQQFLFPLVSIEDQANTRHFLKNYVAGRGQLPVCRIGNQPYGILPATAFSHWEYPSASPAHRYLNSLFQRVLRVLDGQWEQLSGAVPHVGDGFTPGKKFSDRLLQLLGLHASSVEFYVRTLVDPFFSEDVMQVLPDDQLDASFWEVKKGLEQMGFYFERFESASRMFDMVFARAVRPLDGPLIEDMPLSEKRKLHPLPDKEEHYLSWLFQGDLLDELRNESHGMDAAEGLPVLYMLLRHAIIREYMNVAIALLQEAGLASPVAAIDQEREEKESLGAGHEYYLRLSIRMQWQHRVRRFVKEEYDALLSKGLNTRSVAAFERAIGQAFPFFDSNNFLRRTVNQAARKLRNNLIPQPNEDGIREAISTFVKDVEEAIEVQVEQDIESLSSEMLIDPDKWKLLTESYSAVSGSDSMFTFIEAQMELDDPPEVVKDLLEMKAALKLARDLPTAKLERLFVEHLDLCNYRLDAWMLGLVHQRLAEHRMMEGKDSGLYLGAFGYLEDIRPGSIPGFSVKTFEAPQLQSFNGPPRLNEVVVPLFHFDVLKGKGLELEEMLKSAYLYLGGLPDQEFITEPHSGQIIVQPPLDEVGEGFIHAPSLAHANTAALLRSGYATYREPGKDPSLTDPFSVQLSSQRVRRALHHLEGIRNGQELGSLLGYQLERALYEYADQKPPNVDFVSRVPGYVQELRKRFPLQTQENEGESSENEVFTVVNGLGLLQTVERHTGPKHWSTGILTNCPAAHQQLLDLEIGRLEESLDGLSDLLMAESVFQMVKGNTERSAAALKVLNDGGMMTENPQILETPRSGFAFMQRIGIVCTAEAEETGWGTALSPLAIVQPALNAWIASQLPLPGQIGGTALLADEATHAWSLAGLAIQPIDLLRLFAQGDPERPDSAFSQLVADHVRRVTDKEVVSLEHGQALSPYSLLELIPLVQTISELLGLARPLRAEDLYRPSQRRMGEKAASLQLGPILANMEALLTGNGEHALPKIIKRLELMLDEQEAAALSFTGLFDLLLEISAFGISEAIPQVDRSGQPEHSLALSIQAKQVLLLLKRKLRTALAKWNSIGADTEPSEAVEVLGEIGQEVFGRSFKLFPAFRFTGTNPLAALGPVLEETSLELAEWRQSCALVRKKVQAYQKLDALRETFEPGEASQKLAMYQLPATTGAWVGNGLPAEGLPNGDTLSLALDVSEGLDWAGSLWGLVIDEWNEFIPNEATTTAVTFNYNQPDAEAPQVALLAVTPKQTGSWSWDELMDTVTESIQMAKKRAVEPDQVKQTPLAHFLPALLGPINEEGLYPAVDFAKNIKVASEQP